MKLSQTTLTLIASLSLVACVHNDDDGGTALGGGSGGGAGGGGGGNGPLTGCAALDTLDLGPDGTAIVDLDANIVSSIVTDVFDRYAAITTPSEDRIHLLAQAGVSDARIRRAREVLRMHLSDEVGTAAGASKTDVADAISDSCGTLALFANEAEYDLADPAVATFDADFGDAYVPLFGDRIIVEGSPEYLQASPAYDQTFGATAVLVYRKGLTTERPAWADELELASANAKADGTFTSAGPEPYLTLDEAYLGVLMESHAGVWGHDPSGDGSAQDGTYAFGSRPAMAAGDASTLALLEDFFSAEHDFPAEVDPSFAGSFDMLFRMNVGYTHRSQYLTDVTLTGSNSVELLGSSDDNVLVGNAGNNNIRGRSGDDTIDGGDGLDSAIFLAPEAEFTITGNGDGSTAVQHNVVPGLGTDTLRNIEVIVFSDGNVNV